MTNEATLICVDNSEWMRNGDYFPSRLDSQADSAEWIMRRKYDANPEATVGLMSMSGPPEVIVTPCARASSQKILMALNELKIRGTLDLISSIQIAQLALKHRQEKKLKQRMVLFVGSPLDIEQTALVQLGKNLKKNNIAVDVITFGSPEAAEKNGELLTAFIESANSNENCHFVKAAPGSDITEAVRNGGLVGGNVGTGGSGTTGDSGMDADLMAAIQASLAESRPAGETSDAQATPAADPSGPMSEEDLLQRAIRLSLLDAQQNAEDNMETDSPADEGKMEVDTPETEATKSQDATATAEEAGGKTENKVEAKEENVDMDADFVKNVISSLPGVDINNPEIQNILGSYAAASDSSEKKEDKTEDKKEDKEGDKQENAEDEMSEADLLEMAKQMSMGGDGV